MEKNEQTKYGKGFPKLVLRTIAIFYKLRIPFPLKSKLGLAKYSKKIAKIFNKFSWKYPDIQYKFSHNDVRDTNHSHVELCDVTHSYVRHDPFICVMFPHSYSWHQSKEP